MAPNGRKRVLVICMMDSPHVARWLMQFRDEALDFVLIPSSPHRRVHKSISALLNGTHNASFRTVRSLWFFGAPAWLADRLLDNRLRANLLRRYIEGFKPDFVHALELQNAGYLALRYLESRAQETLPFKFLITNYGSDILWFAKFPNHRTKLERLLKLAHSYSCECKRDVRLARRLGFSGKVMPVHPNAGGYSQDDLAKASTLTAARGTIAVKGYQGWVGRAITAIDGIELIADQLMNYQIELYSCNRSTIRRAKRLKTRTGLKVTWSPKGKLSHQQVIELFSRSQIYVGISESDGISTSLLEAMAFGAIPVQTSTACSDEWFTDTGVHVGTISPEAVADAILTALQLAKDPSNAERNRQTISEKASADIVKAAALKYYL